MVGQIESTLDFHRSQFGDVSRQIVTQAECFGESGSEIWQLQFGLAAIITRNNLV